MKRLKYIIIPIVVAISFTFCFNKWLGDKNNKMMNTKDMYTMLHDILSLVKDKGVYANNILSKKDYILMLGSSELSHSTMQHPDYYFNTGRTKNGVVAIGRAYSQSLQHASLLGGLNPDIKNKKVVLLLSMQWFMDKAGVTQHHFQTRFSPIQFYGFMNNKRISKSVKLEYAKRIVKLLEGNGDFKDEMLYASLYIDKATGKNSVYQSILNSVFNPYFKFRQAMVNLKDKGILYETLLTTPDKNKAKTQIDGTIDWNKEKKIALEQAKERVGMKPEFLGKSRIYLDKGYYHRYVKTKAKYYYNSYSYVNLEDSEEYTDFKIFLDACKDLGIKPTIVLMPGMKEFYDYTGIDKLERDKYYNKIKKMTEDYKYRLIDLSNNENSRYYLRDVMHLGTIGWVDLCEKLYNIYER